MKEVINILLLMSFLIMVLNVSLFLNYTGYATSDNQATASLTIQSKISCGDLICNGVETCSTCAIDCGSCPVGGSEGSSGGGGRGTGSVIKDFSADPELINVVVKVGESFEKEITIKNLESVDQSFVLSLTDSLDGLVLISERSFILEANEEKKIILTFVTLNNNLKVYIGKLIIQASSNRKEINIINSIESKEVLFDINLDIPASNRNLNPGEDLKIQLTLFNLGDIGKTDVELEYIIKDFEGNIIYEESEMIIVETQISYSKEIHLGSDILPGEYVVFAVARYGASIGTSSFLFQVEDPKENLLDRYNRHLIIAMIFLILVLLLFVIYKFGKLNKDINAHKGKRLARSERKNSRSVSKSKKNIFGKLLALETAFKEGYISKNSYIKSKQKLKKR